MLSALLNSIQTSLGTKGFLIGSVFPVVICAVANGMLAAQVSPSFRTWLTSLETASEKTLLATAVIAAVIVSAYLLSALASGILETFEGQHWPVSWFRGVLHAAQLAKLRKLEERYRRCFIGIDRVMSGIEGDPEADPPVVGWIKSLKDARTEGQKTQKQCTYPSTRWARLWWRLSLRFGSKSYPDVGIREMNVIRRRRESGREITEKRLQDAVGKLVPVLKANAADGAINAKAAPRALDADCDYLIEAMYFSRDKYQAERLRLYNVRRFRYPVTANASERQWAIVLAPTTLGNISRTTRSYAQNQYGFDLDVLWTRLQNALRSSEPYWSSLQDAKVQLDFFTACSWLAWLSTFAWLGIALVVLRSVPGFVAAGLIGPAVALGAYALACRAYSVFADIMRTGVDLFRFKVLSDLHLPLPLGLEEERVAWQNVASLSYLNLENEGGSKISVTYKHST